MRNRPGRKWKWRRTGILKRVGRRLAQADAVLSDSHTGSVMALDGLFVDAVWSQVNHRWYHAACADAAPTPHGWAQQTDDLDALCGKCERRMGDPPA